MSMIHAPWSLWQVESLQAYQHLRVMHPFTCGKGGHSHGVLTPTRDGWKCEHPGCDYTQDWAHDFMLNWNWVMAHADSPFPTAALRLAEQRLDAAVKLLEECCGPVQNMRGYVSNHSGRYDKLLQEINAFLAGVKG